MARPRYPSDDKRLRQRPHAKVHLSIRSHPTYGHAFEDPETRGIIVGLWVVAIQYHAAQTDGIVTLGQGDLAWITGRTQRQSALNSLRTACELMAYPVRVDGKRVHVEIRNLQRKQGFDSATPAETPRTPSASEEPKYRRTEVPKNRDKEVAAKAAPVGVKKPRKTLAPDQPDFLPELCAWALRKHSLTRQQVEAAWERIHQWSHGGDKRNVDWYRAAQGYISDGWPLRGQPGGNGSAPKSWADQHADNIQQWLEDLDDGSEPRSTSSGSSVRGVSQRRLGAGEDAVSGAAKAKER